MFTKEPIILLKNLFDLQKNCTLLNSTSNWLISLTCWTVLVKTVLYETTNAWSYYMTHCLLHKYILKHLHTCIYYPTLLRRVQITCETSTNITRYLYSSHSSWPCERLKNLASQNFGTRNLWIINHLLYVSVCSIAVNSYSLFVFWLARRARQNKAQLVKI